MKHLAFPDPAPGAEWELWYEDTFDRECPRSAEVSGRGLTKGLAKLWARHLRETVGADGSRGFSRFSLWWERGSTKIVGNREGATRLHKWVFGAERHLRADCVEEADTRLMSRITVAHAHLALADRSCEPILDAAAVAADLEDFEMQLADLSGR